MQIKILFLFILCCFACNNTDNVKSEKASTPSLTKLDFEKEKWMTKKGKGYPHRDKMLPAIFANDTIRQLEKDEVIDLLGPPDRIDSLYLFYLVAQKRAGFLPIQTKTLVIKISDDEKPNKIMIHE